MSLWWLSFADAALPKGSQHLGVVIVEAVDTIAAIKVAWATGCNPGGEVCSMWIDPDQVARLTFKLPVGVLLGPAEAIALHQRINQDLGS